MPSVFRFRNRPDAPEPKRNSTAVFAADDGTLKQVDPDGNVSNVAGEGALPSPSSEGDVLTVVSGDWAGAAPGGGAQTLEYVRTEIAFDTPNLSVQAFAITDADMGANSVTVAGNRTALFPAGRIAAIAGSSSNDYDGYVILSSSFGGGNTTVVFDSPSLNDETADGDLVNSGTAGVTVATLGDGDALLCGSTAALWVCERPTAFNGSSPQLNLYPSDAALQGYVSFLGAAIDADTADDGDNYSGLWKEPVAVSTSSQSVVYPTDGTGAVVVQLFTESTHGAPGSTAGEAVIRIPVLRA